MFFSLNFFCKYGHVVDLGCQFVAIAAGPYFFSFIALREPAVSKGGDCRSFCCSGKFLALRQRTEGGCKPFLYGRMPVGLLG